MNNDKIKCGDCNGSGVVGSPPDQYHPCECTYSGNPRATEAGTTAKGGNGQAPAASAASIDTRAFWAVANRWGSRPQFSIDSEDSRALVDFINSAMNARAEEARREAEAKYRKLAVRMVPLSADGNSVFIEGEGNVLLARDTAQRTAGGDAVKVPCAGCKGTGEGIVNAYPEAGGCSDCNGKGYDWEPVAEAADSAAAAPGADAVCDTCNGSGVQCVGTSGLTDDGNAPLLEPCGACAHGSPVEEAAAQADDSTYKLIGYMPVDSAGYLETGVSAGGQLQTVVYSPRRGPAPNTVELYALLSPAPTAQPTPPDDERAKAQKAIAALDKTYYRQWAKEPDSNGYVSGNVNIKHVVAAVEFARAALRQPQVAGDVEGVPLPDTNYSNIDNRELLWTEKALRAYGKNCERVTMLHWAKRLSKASARVAELEAQIAAAPTSKADAEDAARWRFFCENAQAMIGGKRLAEWVSFDGVMEHGSRSAAIDAARALAAQQAGEVK